MGIPRRLTHPAPQHPPTFFVTFACCMFITLFLALCRYALVMFSTCNLPNYTTLEH